MDRSELEQLYRDYGPTVLRRARAILGTEAEAHDALQEVFVLLLEKGAAFCEASAAPTWVYRIATSVCLERLRRGRRLGSWLPDRLRDAPDNGRSAENLEPIVLMRQWLREAPSDEAHAALCHFMDGLTGTEIAAILECSPRKARTLVERFAMRARGSQNLATTAPEPYGVLERLRPLASADCLSTLELHALYFERLTPSRQQTAAAHVATCSLCQGRLQQHSTELESFVQTYNLGHLAAATIELVEERRPRRHWQRTLMSVSVLGAVAAVFLFVVSQENFAEFASVRLAGGLTLKVFVNRGTDAVQVVSGDTLGPNDALRFELAPFAAPLTTSHLAILGIDGAHKVSLFAADASGNALAFEPMWGWRSEGTTALNGTLGPLAVLVVACPEAFPVAPLISQLTPAVATDSHARTLVPPHSTCVVETLNFDTATF